MSVLILRQKQKNPFLLSKLIPCLYTLKNFFNMMTHPSQECFTKFLKPTMRKKKATNKNILL